MTVLPIPQNPTYTQRYINQTPPAGLVVLQKVKWTLGPAGTDGNGLPPDKISPYSGIYGSDGRLPKIPTAGLTFMAYA